MDQRKTSISGDYISPSKEEHDKIAEELRKNYFLEDDDNDNYIMKISNDDLAKMSNETLKNSDKKKLITYIKAATQCHEQTHAALCDRYFPEEYAKNLTKYTKILNFILEKFSDKNDIKPPIQLFFSHGTPYKDPKTRRFKIDVKDIGCHFACAQTCKMGNDKRYSHGIVKFEEASKKPASVVKGNKEIIDTQTALKLAEQTYFKYRDIECPLLFSKETVAYLEQRYKCEALTIGSIPLPVTVLWQNTNELIHPDKILGDFDNTRPKPLRSSSTLDELAYSKARKFITQEYEKPSSKVHHEGNDYCMTSIDLSGKIPKINGTFGLYYDNILTQYAIEWELKKALRDQKNIDNIADFLKQKSLPLREGVEKGRSPLVNGGGRCTAITISTLVVFQRKRGGLHTIIARRSKSVGVSPGLHHIAPAGMFEAPNVGDPWSIEDNIWRELLEEVYNVKELRGNKYAVLMDYVCSRKPIKLLQKMIEEGKAYLSITGICCDLLNLRPEICTVLYVPFKDFAEERVMKLNWEYKKQGRKGRFGMEWRRIKEFETYLAKSNSIVVSGAACLHLGREWLATRHGI